MHRCDRIPRAADVQLFAKRDRKRLLRPPATGSVGIKRGVPLLLTVDETPSLVVADRICARVSELAGKPGHLAFESLELVLVRRRKTASQQTFNQLDVAVNPWIGRDFDLGGDRPGLRS